ncbi:hypothetical protein DH2020_047852 [Rehmannia glutinosa]|uniref:Kinesin motor domain-containing protein n=1 Tax=Rehmannia glutinosa TaxID=99300 RepID=A0ABR0U8F1_REHGL
MEIMESGEKKLIRGNEERIYVSVRLRPLNDKEILSNDVSDWECINNDTIVYKNVSLLASERSMYPTAYTFDRVFSSDCSTREVYEQGAKDVVISVVRGINCKYSFSLLLVLLNRVWTTLTSFYTATVFAYGQTSSGKTYTMTGVTEYAIADIYEYIHKHPERDFVLKFSAMEIYNETVRDLLSSDSTSLRLLDDPELKDRLERHRLMKRAPGLTRLLDWNNTSTLAAAVDFVDLAGSERASQSLSAGTRLKEGSHINRSLLALGTVIRKLSKEPNGHIPYRDSKLTRILQTSLGGNARTTIICTMSPARSHVEQSRNTLLFASRANEVTTNARVNVVMSDKALVKHLQKELARLESELRSSQSGFAPWNYSAILREKDAQIEKLEKEIKDLILQRDIAQSQVKEFVQILGDDASSMTQVGLGEYPHLRVQKSPDNEIGKPGTSALADPSPDRTFSNGHSRSSTEDHVKVPFFDENFAHNYASPRILLSSSNSSGRDSFIGWGEIEKQSNGTSEDLIREVHCIEMDESNNREPIEINYSSFEENHNFPTFKAHGNGVCRDLDSASPLLVKDQEFTSAHLMDDNAVNESKENTVSISPILETERDFSTIQYLDIASLEKTHHLAKDSFGARSLNFTRSNSCRASITSDSASPWLKTLEYGETTPDVGSEKESEGCGEKICTLNFGASVERLSRKDCQSPPENAPDIEIDTPAVKFSTDEDGISSTSDMREKAELPSEQEITITPEKEITQNVNESPKKNVKEVGLDPIEDECRGGLTSWPVEFRKIQREIIELWHACNVSLVHRTYFFMLFQGDPSDAIYLEVEMRRMKLLKDKFSRGDKTVVDGRPLTLASSAKALRQERRMLSEQMTKKFSEQERETLFVDWGIGLNTKLRRLQLAHRVWSKTEDINHITDSAFLVAKLVGLIEPGQAPNRQMFGVNFTPKCSTGICSFKRSLVSLL